MNPLYPLHESELSTKRPGKLKRFVLGSSVPVGSDHTLTVTQRPPREVRDKGVDISLFYLLYQSFQRIETVSPLRETNEFFKKIRSQFVVGRGEDGRENR